MRYVKMLGLAAIAAAALMAFAGSASATVLCKTSTTTGCASGGNSYAKGTTIEATMKAGSSMTFVSGGVVEDTCTGSTMKGTTGNTGSSTETIIINLSSYLWSGCTNPAVTTKLGTFEWHIIVGTDNATITLSGMEWTVNSFASCVYKSGTGNDLGTLKGGTTAAISISTTVTSTSGFPCPSVATWNAEYTVTNPDSLFTATS